MGIDWLWLEFVFVYCRECARACVRVLLFSAPCVFFSVFVSVFCAARNSFREREVCLCDVGTPSLHSPPQPSSHHSLRFTRLLLSFAVFAFFFFYHLNRELPFTHHPAWSNHHHHQLSRHPALSPRCHREVFDDQRASAGPASQRLTHLAQRQAQLWRCCRVCKQALHPELL